MRCLAVSPTLESRALQAFCCLRLSRLDLADKELKAMTQMDEDSTLTQLTSAWVSLAHGSPDKLKEAQSILQELSDKFTVTPMLLNGLAVVAMQQGKFEDAEPLLLEALEKSPQDGDALANLAACHQHLLKPREHTTRLLRQLRTASPSHSWLSAVDQFEQRLDRAAGISSN